MAADEIYTLPDKPSYHTDIRKLQDGDPASASNTFNPVLQKIVENAHYAKLRADENSELLAASTTAKREIAIPTTGWNTGAEEGKAGGLYIDIEQDDVTESMTPIISIFPAFLEAAKECGMSTTARTLAGGLRLYAEKAPETEIRAELTLLQTSAGTAIGGGSSGGGNYILPVATANRLGGVRIGKNVNVEQDGTISVDEMRVLDEAVATGDDAQEMLDSVFGDKESDQTEN